MSVDVPPQKSASEHCKSCNHTLRAGEIICPNCGIPTTSTGKTHKMMGTHGLADDDKGWSFATRNVMDATIVFEIGDQKVALPFKDSFVIGRSGSGYSPEVDLMPFGADDKGVSRQHLQIKRELLIYVTDLGSTNGTFINGRKLVMNSDYLLNDGDELHIGYLKVHVRFRWS